MDGGTEYHSAYGASSASGEDSPQCSTTAAVRTPRSRSRRKVRAVSGRPALGISALPGVSACPVRYAASGHGAAV